jgi:hypothetical protein
MADSQQLLAYRVVPWLPVFFRTCCRTAMFDQRAAAESMTLRTLTEPAEDIRIDTDRDQA